MLHNQIEKIIGIFLDSNNDEIKSAVSFISLSTSSKAPLISYLQEPSCWTLSLTLPKPLNSSYQGINHIILTSFFPNESRKYERKITRGYHGQITNFANKLAVSKDPVVQKFIEEHQDWKDFVETTLAEINKKNDTKLGGKDPRQGQDEEEEFSSDGQLQLPVRFYCSWEGNVLICL